MHKIELTLTILVVAFILVLFVLPQVCSLSSNNEPFDKQVSRGDKNARQNCTVYRSRDTISGVDPLTDYREHVSPQGDTYNYESLIYDSTTGAVMTGTQFMKDTGIVAPLWIPPAWDPNALGPSSKGKINPSEYENDSRLLYNKCSLSCCGPQYPLPFQPDEDPFTCDKDGNNKYLTSDLTCTNNAGGTGCMCLTPNQVAQ